MGSNQSKEANYIPISTPNSKEKMEGISGDFRLFALPFGMRGYTLSSLMKILFLTTELPFPAVSGGIIKTWRLLQHWSSHDLSLIFPLKEDREEDLIEFQRKLPHARLFCKLVEKPRNPANLLKSYVSAASLNIFRNYDVEIAQKVADWSKDADLIFIDHYEMGQYIPADVDIPVVLHEHNAEYVLWQRAADNTDGLLKKWAISLESNRVKKAEKLYCDRSDLILAAPSDIEKLVNLGVPREKFSVTYHLGEDEMLNLPEILFEETEKALLFVGTLSWEANIDGLIWFLKKVWPQVRAEEPDAVFYIIGKNAPEKLRSEVERSEGAVLTGFIEDLEPWYKKARIFIIPLRFGSGIKVKLLNALYRGIPVVTTPIGLESLDLRNKKEVFSSRFPADIKDFILDLLKNKTKWEAVRSAARKQAQNYTWKPLLEKHDSELEALVKNRDRK